MLALGTHRTILVAFFTDTVATLVMCLPFYIYIQLVAEYKVDQEKGWVL